MEYFVYHDGNEPWMNIRVFSDDRYAAHEFMMKQQRCEGVTHKDIYERTISACELLSAIKKGNIKYRGPILVMCDRSKDYEDFCYRKICSMT